MGPRCNAAYLNVWMHAEDPEQLSRAVATSTYDRHSKALIHRACLSIVFRAGPEKSILFM